MPSMTTSEAIARLNEYNPQAPIAINWWSEEDFEDYPDKGKALALAQQFLDRINPELKDYVFIQYEMEESNA